MSLYYICKFDIFFFFFTVPMDVYTANSPFESLEQCVKKVGRKIKTTPAKDATPTKKGTPQKRKAGVFSLQNVAFKRMIMCFSLKQVVPLTDRARDRNVM